MVGMSPDLPDFVASLRQGLSSRARLTIERDERAAVLVPIVEEGGSLSLLLTRRTEALPTHRGHVAFPGGHVDPSDADPAATALREAEEEIALPPRLVDVIGLLDDHLTREEHTAVTPVVGLVSALPPLRPRAEEVARVFTIPLAALALPDRWRREGPLYYFDHDGEVLWGLSARIVLHLLEVAGAGAPL